MGTFGKTEPATQTQERSEGRLPEEGRLSPDDRKGGASKGAGLFEEAPEGPPSGAQQRVREVRTQPGVSEARGTGRGWSREHLGSCG